MMELLSPLAQMVIVFSLQALFNCFTVYEASYWKYEFICMKMLKEIKNCWNGFSERRKSVVRARYSTFNMAQCTIVCMNEWEWKRNFAGSKCRRWDAKSRFILQNPSKIRKMSQIVSKVLIFVFHYRNHTLTFFHIICCQNDLTRFFSKPVIFL